MKRVLAVLAAVAAALGVVVIAGAQAPAEVPFPAGKSDVAVFAYTVTAVDSTAGPAGARNNFFARGSRVVFHAYAGDVKTKKVLTDQDVQFFYVEIPNQPKLKLAYTDVGGTFLWTGSWFIPADYPAGVVSYRVLVKTKTKRYGSFVETPIANAALNVRA